MLPNIHQTYRNAILWNTWGKCTQTHNVISKQRTMHPTTEVAKGGERVLINMNAPHWVMQICFTYPLQMLSTYSIRCTGQHLPSFFILSLHWLNQNRSIAGTSKDTITVNYSTSVTLFFMKITDKIMEQICFYIYACQLMWSKVSTSPKAEAVSKLLNKKEQKSNAEEDVW